MSFESALLALGTSTVKAAVKLWLGDSPVLGDVGPDAVGQLSETLSTKYDQRKFRRMFQELGDSVAKRLEPTLNSEFGRLSRQERQVATLAVQRALDLTPLRLGTLLEFDLDSRALSAHIIRNNPMLFDGMSEGQRDLADLLVRECSSQLIDISRGLPPFDRTALTEVLRRETQILNQLREVTSRIPVRQRQDLDDFGYDYRQLVARILDQVELFGASLSDRSRRYHLSSAYVSLELIGKTGTPSQPREVSGNHRIETLLRDNRRLFIRGEAGLGKTTLLRWIAVRCALRDLPDTTGAWKYAMPFFLPLRRYGDQALPTPDRFLEQVGRHIADDMPPGWVSRQLQSGNSVVLIDGVDELPPVRRPEARDWLKELVVTFPSARFVITSRPGAAPPSWLDELDFAVADIQQMSATDVRRFVDRWHTALAIELGDEGSRERLNEWRDRLQEQLTKKRYLRRLAGTPLFCALICALNFDRNSVLPTSRMELYQVALQMLLGRRDAERGIAEPAGLATTEKRILLSDLAYWMLRNSYSTMGKERVLEHLSTKLQRMPQVGLDAVGTLRLLVERTGILREPVVGQIDFAHRTFMEYLAAHAAVVDQDDVGVLVANAASDQWQETIIMAAGQASARDGGELLSGLLEEATKYPKANRVNLLAVACLETIPELSIELRQRIEGVASDLVPPKTREAARTLAAAGTFVLDLLVNAAVNSTEETVSTIYAASLIEGAESLPVVARFRSDTREDVQNELVRAWPNFDAETFAREVLSHTPMNSMQLDDANLAPHLRELNQLRTLTCEVPGDGGLGFVPKSVVELALSGSRFDFWSLDAPQVETLRVYVVGGWYLDLDPLLRLSSLREVEIVGGTVMGLSGIQMRAAFALNLRV